MEYTLIWTQDAERLEHVFLASSRDEAIDLAADFLELLDDPRDARLIDTRGMYTRF